MSGFCGLEITALPVHFTRPKVLGQIYLCKVVKSVEFGPIFLAHNDYIKLMTLQTCWMYLQFALVVYRIMFFPIGTKWSL